jgi:ASC-1-like (ASCH) protein
MRQIEKKTWPKFFNEVKSGKKVFEVRLANFKLNKGDVLILREYNPKTKKYTGRTVTKKVTFVTEFNPLKFNKLKDIKKYGLYGIGLK